jgi:fatty acid desaturase
MWIANGALLGLLWALGHPALYLLWLGAYITPFPLFVRIRSIAEHGVLPRVTDMFQNTRTTRANWLLRMFVAPVHVNFHIEHHALASVPYYRLPRLHALLLERGMVTKPPSYGEVLRLASASTAQR